MKKLRNILIISMILFFGINDAVFAQTPEPPTPTPSCPSGTLEPGRRLDFPYVQSCGHCLPQPTPNPTFTGYQLPTSTPAGTATPSVTATPVTTVGKIDTWGLVTHEFTYFGEAKLATGASGSLAWSVPYDARQTFNVDSTTPLNYYKFYIEMTMTVYSPAGRSHTFKVVGNNEPQTTTKITFQDTYGSEVYNFTGTFNQTVKYGTGSGTYTRKFMIEIWNPDVIRSWDFYADMYMSTGVNGDHAEAEFIMLRGDMLAPTPVPNYTCSQWAYVPRDYGEGVMGFDTSETSGNLVNIVQGDCYVVIPGISVPIPENEWFTSEGINVPQVQVCTQLIRFAKMQVFDFIIPIETILILPFIGLILGMLAVL